MTKFATIVLFLVFAFCGVWSWMDGDKVTSLAIWLAGTTVVYMETYMKPPRGPTRLGAN